MDFVGSGEGSENGPILYSEPNRTSAIDDIRSVVIYIFIITIFASFFLILPGIRYEKLPTFLCITTSLIVTSIILVTLFGTSWHVSEAPISAAYKAFSRDRIQGDLSVKIGLQSVNITLRAHKYYILHATHGPIMMDNSPILASTTTQNTKPPNTQQVQSTPSTSTTTTTTLQTTVKTQQVIQMQKYTIKRVNVDINYNERFYWIEPNQMRQEHHKALERGLPYPILTVVEYLSQDAAGFSWSRQYRLAGYYSHITLWLSLGASILMFILHCAAPKYGIYTMQVLGCLLLLTNFTYAILVPKGEQKLVIPFEGQSLSFEFGWHYWLVLFGGCLSLAVGTLFVIVDSLLPNFIFTTVLDVDFDSHNTYYARVRRDLNQIDQRPVRPPFFHDSTSSINGSLASTSKTSSFSSIVGSSTERSHDHLSRRQVTQTDANTDHHNVRL